MTRIALYRGTSFESRVIRWVTRSVYSHAAFLLADGSVIEAWANGVQHSPNISSLHSPGTRVDVFRFTDPLDAQKGAGLVELLMTDIGRPYDYKDVFRFITRRAGNPNGRVFCSELVAQRCKDVGRPLFRDTEPWRVPPDWIARTIALAPDGTLVTI